MAKFPSHLLGRPGIHDGVTVESCVFHRETSLPSTLTPYRLARTWFPVASTAASFTLPFVCSFTSVAAAAHSGSRLQKTPCTLKGMPTLGTHTLTAAHISIQSSEITLGKHSVCSFMKALTPHPPTLTSPSFIQHAPPNLDANSLLISENMTEETLGTNAEG